MHIQQSDRCDNPRTPSSGFTLVELMIAVAILAIVAAIAIPTYNGYIREAKLGVARQNMESLRFFLEDYGLENSSYIVGADTSYTEAELDTYFGWTPTGDQNKYTYEVTASTTSYDILVRYEGTAPWLRCEDRMNNCCDDKTGAGISGC